MMLLQSSRKITIGAGLRWGHDSRMSEETLPISQQEHRAIICICVLAAFADGAQGEGERARIRQIVNGFSEEHIDLASAYQDVLEGKIAASNEIQSATGRALAYEMAVCVCNADGVLNDAENKFLAELLPMVRQQ